MTYKNKLEELKIFYKTSESEKSKEIKEIKKKLNQLEEEKSIIIKEFVKNKQSF